MKKHVVEIDPARVVGKFTIKSDSPLELSGAALKAIASDDYDAFTFSVEDEEK